MARIRELAPIVQAGIRSMSAEEVPYAEMERIFTAHDLYHDKTSMKLLSESLQECLYNNRS